MGQTLFDKIWENHVIKTIDNGPSFLAIDVHLIHEVTSPQAFQFIKAKKLSVKCPDKTFATCDHNTPTQHQERPLKDPSSASAISALAANTKEYGIIKELITKSFNQYSENGVVSFNYNTEIYSGKII